jgi:hypothetical protein
MKMKLLMENFKKFIEEEGEMDSEDAVIDSILDDVLGSIMMEGLDDAPNKEEIKSDIKKALKAPEVVPVLQKMSEEALRDQDIQAGLRAAIDSYGDELKLAAASIPGISILGAVLGNFNEPANAMHLDPSVLNAILTGNMKFGAAVGAVIGAAFLSSVVVDFFKRANSVKKSSEDGRKDAEWKKSIDDKLASDAAKYRERKGI